jgi:hypothetical protein
MFLNVASLMASTKELRVAMNGNAGENAYSIFFCEQTRILYLTFSGFWTSETAARFCEDIKDVVKDLSSKMPMFQTLVDQREFSVQSPDTIRILNEAFAQSRDNHSGSIALVTPTVLGKFQIERNLSDTKLRVFNDLDVAKDWLASATNR